MKRHRKRARWYRVCGGIGGMVILCHEAVKWSLDTHPGSWRAMDPWVGMGIAQFFLNTTSYSVAILLVGVALFHFMLEFHHFYKYGAVCLCNIRSVLMERLHMYANIAGVIEAGFQFSSPSGEVVDEVAIKYREVLQTRALEEEELLSLKRNNAAVLQKVSALETDLHGIYTVHRIYEVFRLLLLKVQEYVDHGDPKQGKQYLNSLLVGELAVLIKCLDYITRIENYTHRYLLGLNMPSA